MVDYCQSKRRTRAPTSAALRHPRASRLASSSALVVASGHRAFFFRRLRRPRDERRPDANFALAREALLRLLNPSTPTTRVASSHRAMHPTPHRVVVAHPLGQAPPLPAKRSPARLGRAAGARRVLDPLADDLRPGAVLESPP